MKKQSVFATFGASGAAFGAPGNGPWQNQFRLGVAQIDPKFVEKHARFSLLDLPGA